MCIATLKGGLGDNRKPLRGDRNYNRELEYKNAEKKPISILNSNIISFTKVIL